MRSLRESDPSESELRALNDKCTALEIRVHDWRENADRYLGPLVAAAAQERVATTVRPTTGGLLASEHEVLTEASDHDMLSALETEEGGEAVVSESASPPAARRQDETAPAIQALVSGFRIALPSDYKREIWQRPAMSTAVQIEMQLRRAQANDALEDLRTQLITATSFRHNNRHVTGNAAVTRAKAAAGRKMDAVRASAEVYRRARRAMVALDMPEDDNTYRKLQTDDLRAFAISVADQQRGDSRKAPSWIWGDLSFAEGGQDAAVREYIADSAYSLLIARSELTAPRSEARSLVSPAGCGGAVERGGGPARGGDAAHGMFFFFLSGQMGARERRARDTRGRRRRCICTQVSASQQEICLYRG